MKTMLDYMYKFYGEALNYRFYESHQKSVCIAAYSCVSLWRMRPVHTHVTGSRCFMDERDVELSHCWTEGGEEKKAHKQQLLLRRTRNKSSLWNYVIVKTSVDLPTDFSRQDVRKWDTVPQVWPKIQNFLEYVKLTWDLI